MLGFPGVSVVKNPPAKQEMWVQSLCQEDLLEKEMTTHSSILAQEIPWTEEPGGLHTLHRVTKTQTQLSDYIATTKIMFLSLFLCCFYDFFPFFFDF